jgi:hypothetical protein
VEDEGQLSQDNMGFMEEEGTSCATSGMPTYQYGCSDGDKYLEESEFEFGGAAGYEEDSSLEQDSTTDSNQPIKEDFQKYVEHASKSFGLFSSLEVNAITLLQMLRHSVAPLGMYKVVMGWHLDILKRQQIGTKPMVNRNTLIKQLKKCYNMAHDTNIIYNVTLPNSCANAKIVTNSTKWCIQSLLTDPSIKDSDYLFHNDNPLSEPPGDLEYVSDINTGATYLESYKKICEDSWQTGITSGDILY